MPVLLAHTVIESDKSLPRPNVVLVFSKFKYMCQELVRDSFCHQVDLLTYCADCE